MDNAALIALPVSEIRGLLTQEAHQEGNPRQDEIEGPSRVLSRDLGLPSAALAVASRSPATRWRDDVHVHAPPAAPAGDQVSHGHERR